MSVDATNAVWRHADAKGSNLLVLMAIADNADEETCEAYPGYEYLAAKTRLSKRAVQYCVAKLLDSGELILKRRGARGRSNLYIVPVQSLRCKPDRIPRRELHDTTQDEANTTQPIATEPSEPSEEPPTEPTAEKKEEERDPTRERLCQLMADLVNERAESQRAKVTETWRKEMRLLMERDGRTAEQVEFVIRWVHQDSFESGVVLGVPKLRDRFDILVVKIKRANGGGGTNGKAAAVSQNVENLRQTARQLRERGQ